MTKTDTALVGAALCVGAVVSAPAGAAVLLGLLVLKLARKKQAGARVPAGREAATPTLRPGDAPPRREN